jgi:hypothetical protein
LRIYYRHQHLDGTSDEIVPPKTAMKCNSKRKEKKAWRPEMRVVVKHC